MKLLKRSDQEPKEENRDFVTERALRRSIIVSAIGILLCMTCLFSVTWAWYTASVVTEPNQISSATYDLDITVTEHGTSNTVSKDMDGYYILDQTKTYDITLTKKNTATATTGYCHLSVAKTAADTDTAYYTGSVPYIENNNEKPFVFTVSGVYRIRFTPMWGTCKETTNVIPYNGSLTLTTNEGGTT